MVSREPALPLLPPAPLEGVALEQLRFIHETMERAASFTAVPGWGTAAVGATALAAGVLAASRPTPDGRVGVWLAEAALAATIGVGATVHKARRSGTPLVTGAGGRFLAALGAPLLVGALLTVALLRADLHGLLPGVWLLLYGTGLVAAGAFSIPLFRGMGASFLAVGAAALFAPAGARDALMAAGFGGLHLLFGVRIARRHGG